MRKTSKMFRGSMRGFNKADVNNYIVSQNREFDEKKALLEDEISRLRLNCNDLQTKLSKAEGCIIDLNAELVGYESTKSELEALQHSYEELTEKRSSLQSENSALQENVAALQAENNALQEKLAAAEALTLQVTELQEEIARLSSEVNTEVAVPVKPVAETPREERSECIEEASDKATFSDALANAIISEVITKINSNNQREKVILRRDRILDVFRKNLAEAQSKLKNYRESRSGTKRS